MEFPLVVTLSLLKQLFQFQKKANSWCVTYDVCRSLYAWTYEGTESYISPFQLNKPLEGACVGQVIESKNIQFKVGDYVLSNYGWREYWLSSDSNGVTKIDPKIVPIQSYLGIMGLTGLTAYVGLLKVG